MQENWPSPGLCGTSAVLQITSVAINHQVLLMGTGQISVLLEVQQQCTLHTVSIQTYCNHDIREQNQILVVFLHAAEGEQTRLWRDSYLVCTTQTHCTGT